MTQINIRVFRIEKKRPKWGIRLTEIAKGEIPMRSILPGEIDTWHRTQHVAKELAAAYRESGYKVALDTKTCRRRREVVELDC